MSQRVSKLAELLDFNPERAQGDPVPLTLEELQANGFGPANSFGIDPPAEDPGLLRSMGDTAIAATTGITTGVKLLSDIFGAGNPVSQSLGDFRSWQEQGYSPARQQELQARARTIQEAEQSGSTLDQVGAYLGHVTDAPVDTIVNALGTTLPSILATLFTSGAAGPAVVGLNGARAAQAASALTPRLAGAVVGAAQGAGAAKSQIYDQVYQELVGAGLPEADARARADAAQEYLGRNAGAILMNVGLGALAGSSGVEGAIAGPLSRASATMSRTRQTLASALAESLTEASQGGAERLAGNQATYNEGFDTPLMQGVVGQAALEGVAGAGLGAGAAALAPRRSDQPDKPLGESLFPSRGEAPMSAQDQAGKPESANGTRPGGGVDAEGAADAGRPADIPTTDAEATPAGPPTPQPARAAEYDPATDDGVWFDGGASGLTPTDRRRLARLAGMQETVGNRAWRYIPVNQRAALRKQYERVYLDGQEPAVEPPAPPAPVEIPDIAAEQARLDKEAREAIWYGDRGTWQSLAELNQELAARRRTSGTSVKAKPVQLPDGRYTFAVQGEQQYRDLPDANRAASESVRDTRPTEKDSLASQLATALGKPGLPAVRQQAQQVDWEVVDDRGRVLSSPLPQRASAANREPAATDRITAQRRPAPPQVETTGAAATSNNTTAGPPNRAAVTGRNQSPNSPRPAPLPAMSAGAGGATVDTAAHQAATSPTNDLPEPTEAQKKAGNYKVGRIAVAGLPISIENPAGSERRGRDDGGREWRTKLYAHYGYVRGSLGADGDHVDVFVKPGLASDYRGPVYVVDQVHPKTGKFDEHKVLLGYKSAGDARKAYLANYEKGWKGLQALTRMSTDEFKSWLDSGNTKRPLAPGPDQLSDMRRREEAMARETPANEAVSGDNTAVNAPGSPDEQEQPAVARRARGGSGRARASRTRSRRPVAADVPESRQGDDGRRDGGAADQGAGRTGKGSDRPAREAEPASGAPRADGDVRGEPEAAGSGVEPDLGRDTPRAAAGVDDPASDHFIEDTDEVGAGGKVAKFRGNLEAIRLLKDLEATGRKATAAEQKALAAYVGWGGIKEVFNSNQPVWSKRRQDLEALLTADEFAAARRSQLDAHYTSMPIVDAIWQGIGRAGFISGRVLEPAMGTGNFFGRMPKDMRRRSQLYGVELDDITARIARQLYQRARIDGPKGFQQAELPNGVFDVAIGNPPFGSQTLFDPNHKDISSFSIHNFFFAKSVEKLRPGGMLGMVVSRYLMDAGVSPAREWLAQRTRLVGAFRLPETAFRANAGTDVVTDVIFLQKLGEGETSPDTSWTRTGEVTLQRVESSQGPAQATHQINQYFIDHPDHVIGQQGIGRSMHTDADYIVKPPEGEQDAGEALKTLVAKVIPEGIYSGQTVEWTQEHARANVLVPENLQVGAFFEEDGTLYQRTADVAGERTAVAAEPEAKATGQRLRGMIRVRDALRSLMRAELDPESTDADLTKMRKVLNEQYDAFVKRHGYINQLGNRRAMADDPNLPLLESLEPDYDPGISAAKAKASGEDTRAPSAKKADIFSRRALKPITAITKAETPYDALVASLNERGAVDPAYMERLAGKPFASMLSDLGDAVYNDPDNGWMTRAEYLSGDVKAKLRRAQEAAKADPELQRNVGALESVQPADLPPSKIDVRLGAPWVTPDDYARFARETIGAEMTFTHVRAIGKWVVNTGRTDADLNSVKWGTRRVGASTLLMEAMNNKAPVVIDRSGDRQFVNQQETEAAVAKQNALKEEFERWIWADDERRARLAASYNEAYNNIVPYEPDGSHLRLPGMNPGITLLDHQKRAIWRGVTQRTLLLDHTVGAGKTFEMIGMAMEMRRLGIANKPFFVVPNHLVGQWRDSFYQLYPAASVLAAREVDFEKANRARLYSRIATGDWDAVIVGESSLKKIDLQAETAEAFLKKQVSDLADQIQEIKQARGDRNVLRDMERIKEGLDARLQRARAKGGSKDRTLTFEELGVDALFVDEAHLFKNLWFTTQMQGTGFGNPAGSGKALDLFMKTRWMDEYFGGKAVKVFATGTPVSNSITEMFHMMRYLAFDQLERDNIAAFDSWAAVFGKVSQEWETPPSGTGVRVTSRLKFQNLGELISRYRQMADVMLLEDLKRQEEAQGKRFPVPKIKGGKPENVVVPRTPRQAEIYGQAQFARDPSGEILFTRSVDSMAVRRVEFDEGLQGPGYEIVSVVQTPEGTQFGARVTDQVFQTESQAYDEVLALATEPVTQYEEGSILHQFANLGSLNRASNGKINALSISNRARKAALDARLVDPGAADDPKSKVNEAVRRIVDIYKRWDDRQGAQLVFLDLSTPLSERQRMASDARKVFVRADDGTVKQVKGTTHAVERDGQDAWVVHVAGAGQALRAYDAVTGVELRGVGGNRAAILEGLAGRDRARMVGDSAPISEADIDDWRSAQEGDGNDNPDDQVVDLTEIAGLASGAGFSVYDDMRAKLVDAGVPDEQIAFIHDYPTSKKKAELYDKVNAGEIRVLFGSTPKMGAGMNAQRRLVALHHIDVPWKPSDLEQREGRIVRRGNLFFEQDPDGFEIQILRYATEQTYDTRMWQIVQHKARAIGAMRAAGFTDRTVDDLGAEAANATEMKAAASGNPLIAEEVQLRAEVKRLHALRGAYIDEQDSIQHRLRSLYATDERLARARERVSKLLAVRDKNASDKVLITVAGKAYEKQADAVKAIARVSAEAVGDSGGKWHDLGSFQGFAVRVRGRTVGGSVMLLDLEVLNGQETLDGWTVDASEFKPAGTIQRLRNFVATLDNVIPEAEQRAQAEKARIPGLEEQLGKPFEGEQALVNARNRHQEIFRKLRQQGGGVEMSEKMRAELEQARAQVALRLAKTRGGLEAALADQPPAVPSQAGPGVGRAQKASAEAVRDVFALESLQGLALSKNLAERQRTRLTGHTVSGPQDLAALAQVYRDPRFESFRLFFADKTGKIIAQSGLTSRMAASAPSFIDLQNDSEYLRGLVGRAKKLGATKVWALHNHPSGDPSPSPQDIAETSVLAGFLADVGGVSFEGHVVIDTNRYAFISAGEATETAGSLTAPVAEVFDADFGQPEAFESLSEKPLGSPDDLARFAMSLERRSGSVIVVGLANDNRVMSVGRLNEWDLVNKPKSIIRKKLARAAVGAQRVAVVTESSVAFGAMRGTAGEMAMATLLVNGKGRVLRNSSVSGGGAGTLVEGGARRARRTPDSSPELQPSPGPTAAGGVAETIGAFSAEARKGAVDALLQRLNDGRANKPTFSRWYRFLNTQYHKATLNPFFKRVFDSVQAFQQDVSIMANRAAELAPELLPNITNVKEVLNTARVAKEDLDVVSRAVFEGTLAGGENPAKGRRWNADELRSRFGMTDKQIGLYEEFRAATDKSLDDYGRTEILRYMGKDAPEELRAEILQAASMNQAAQLADEYLGEEAARLLARINIKVGPGPYDRVASTPEEQAAIASQLQQIDDLRETIRNKHARVEDLKKAGYAPLMRFGKHAVWIRTEDRNADGGYQTLWFSAHDSLAEANRVGREMLEEIKQDTPDAQLKQGTVSEEEHRIFSGVTPETLEIFGKATKLDENPMWKDYIRLVKNNRSALKRMLERKGTAGYSQDLPRVLAAFITSNARASSANVHAGEVKERLDEIPQWQGDVKDEAIKLVRYMENPVEEAQALRGAMFIWFLGGSVASAAVNMTQPATMTFPYLAVKEGARKAAARLAAAAKTMARGDSDEDLQRALHQAKFEGITEPQEIHQLQAEASRNMGSNLTWRKFMFGWGFLFSAAERLNRELSFIAAYTQARDMGAQDPYSEAVKAVVETQGIYNRGNRPNIARGAVGATVMTFRQYSIAYIEFVARLLKSGDPAERRAGFLALGVLVVLSGLQGLPFMEDLDDVLDTLGQAAGYNVRAEAWKERVIADMLGEHAASLLTRGVSAFPGMPFDVQARLGLANLIPGTGAFKKSAPPSAGKSELFEVAGVAGGLAQQAGRAIESTLAGEYGKAAGAFMPVALTNAHKAYQMLMNGYYLDRRGRRVTEVEPIDAFWKGLGFQPARVAQVQRKEGDILSMVAVNRRIESEIANLWAEGLFESDPDKVSEAQDRLKNFNEKNPETPIRLTRSQLKRRVQQMGLVRGDRIVKAAPREIRGRVAQAIATE